MARISGVELKDNWKLDFALTRIKGIGWTRSKEIVEKLKLNPKTTVSALKTEEMTKISSLIESFDTEGDLLRRLRENVQRLKVIGSYRGVRHARGLPSRGQRTRSNARTKRGKRRTVGAYKKEML